MRITNFIKNYPITVASLLLLFFIITIIIAEGKVFAVTENEKDCHCVSHTCLNYASSIEEAQNRANSLSCKAKNGYLISVYCDCQQSEITFSLNRNYEWCLPRTGKGCCSESDCNNGNGCEPTNCHPIKFKAEECTGHIGDCGNCKYIREVSGCGC